MTRNASSPLSSARFYHVAVAVRDGNAAAKWYQDKLGFTLLNSKAYPDLGTRILFLEWNGFKLELIEDKAIKSLARRENPPKHTRLPGMAQFSFTVDDLDKAADFFRDGEGNLIQLLQMLK